MIEWIIYVQKFSRGCGKSFSPFDNEKGRVFYIHELKLEVAISVLYAWKGARLACKNIGR